MAADTPEQDGVPVVRRCGEAIRVNVGRVTAGKESTLDLLLNALLELRTHPCPPAVADYFFLGWCGGFERRDGRNVLFGKDAASVCLRADVDDGCILRGGATPHHTDSSLVCKLSRDS